MEFFSSSIFGFGRKTWMSDIEAEHFRWNKLLKLQNNLLFVNIGFEIIWAEVQCTTVQCALSTKVNKESDLAKIMFLSSEKFPISFFFFVCVCFVSFYEAFNRIYVLNSLLLTFVFISIDWSVFRLLRVFFFSWKIINSTNNVFICFAIRFRFS